ncbi:MAG: hypothetical protein GW938_15445 [Leptospira sp.]|nr:hypothetical protein [Leptospira sp.]
MEDLIIKEVRKIKTELEQDSKNDFEIIFKKHKEMNQLYKSRIINKDDLELKNEIPTIK